MDITWSVQLSFEVSSFLLFLFAVLKFSKCVSPPVESPKSGS